MRQTGAANILTLPRLPQILPEPTDEKIESDGPKKYRKVLEALSSRVRSDADGMVDQVRSGSGGNGGSDLSNAPFHLGDMGTDEFLYDMNATLLVNEQYIVAEAREALNRLDNGTYGICESCGRSIASARLEAIPFARFCVKCAETNDQTPQVNLDEGRPHSPKDTLAPEGEMDEDRVARQSARIPAAAHPSRRRPRGRHRRRRHSRRRTRRRQRRLAAIQSLPNSTKQPPAAHFDVEDDRPDDRTPLSGRSGGAVGGTPARKRAK